uniref:MARVEL domain-containing protein n=1 Tax=Rhabditophanes sp. KR3021 TaxID=114890 RepID=A0AC35TM54_9BILA
MDLEESSEETDFTKSPYGRLVGRKIVRVRVTTPDPLEDEHEERRKRPIQRRYHLLSGGVQGNSVPFPTSGPINRNKEAKSNNWLHGIVNSNDPAFSNKGEIRAVNMKQAKRRPKVQLDRLKEKFSKSKSGNNVSESGALSKTEVEVPEVITLFGGPASLHNDIKKDIEKNTEKSIEKDVSQNSPIISDSISSGNEKDVFKEEQVISEVVMDETVKEQTTKDAEGGEAEEKDVIEYKIIDVAKETSTMATFDYPSGWDVAENEYEEGEFKVNKGPTRETLTASKPRPICLIMGRTNGYSRPHGYPAAYAPMPAMNININQNNGVTSPVLSENGGKVPRPSCPPPSAPSIHSAPPQYDDDDCYQHGSNPMWLDKFVRRENRGMFRLCLVEFLLAGVIFGLGIWCASDTPEYCPYYSAIWTSIFYIANAVVGSVAAKRGSLKLYMAHLVLSMIALAMCIISGIISARNWTAVGYYSHPKVGRNHAFCLLGQHDASRISYIFSHMDQYDFGGCLLHLKIGIAVNSTQFVFAGLEAFLNILSVLLCMKRTCSQPKY